MPTVQPQRARLGALVRQLDDGAAGAGPPAAGRRARAGAARARRARRRRAARRCRRPRWRCCGRSPRRPGRVVSRAELLRGAARRRRRRARRRDGGRPAARRARRRRRSCRPSSSAATGSRSTRARGRARSAATACTGRCGDPRCWSRTARGTRQAPSSPSGSPSARDRLLGVPVHACYADVRGPTPADVLTEVGGPHRRGARVPRRRLPRPRGRARAAARHRAWRRRARRRVRPRPRARRGRGRTPHRGRCPAGRRGGARGRRVERPARAGRRRPGRPAARTAARQARDARPDRAGRPAGRAEVVAGCGPRAPAGWPWPRGCSRLACSSGTGTPAAPTWWPRPLSDHPAVAELVVDRYRAGLAGAARAAS